MQLDVLDHGYVRLVDHMGTDLSIVNAARVSFAKESLEMSYKDARLLKYLVNHGHMSPFRHAMVTLEVKAPLFIARQWWKYVVGSDHTMDGWNETSRRYVEDEPEFYIPEVWRSAPEDKKQGSGEPVNKWLGAQASSELEVVVDRCVSLYEDYLEKGICAEQARGFLPANFQYTTWRWTASLESVAHFIKQRTETSAQHEITRYAYAVRELVMPLFPMSFEALDA